MIKRVGIIFISCWILLGTVYAKSYQWQQIRFEYSNIWEVVTNRTVNGNRIIRLSQQVQDSYPLSIMLSFIPKSIKGNQHFDTNNGMPGGIKAVDYAWPLIKRFANIREKSDLLVTFNQVLVSNNLASGALVLVPTPKKGIYISGQTFYLAKRDYYILGCVISRVDKGVMRRSSDYAKRIKSAYILLRNLKFGVGP